MVEVSAYERPGTIDEALTALKKAGAVPIGGGTRLGASSAPQGVSVVDLQAAGIGGIRRLHDGKVLIGATATLDELAFSRELPEVVREAARRERPSALRTLSTVGGCVAAAEAESELIAALLVHRANVRIAGTDGVEVLMLADLLGHPQEAAGRIITHVEIETDGAAATARVGRTPADIPIVAAVARRDSAGKVLLAFSGVAAVPVLAESPEELDPPGDFRGSGEYRKAMAATLGARAREALR